MTKPNFLIIGAAKSGTTALYKYIEEHPEVYMSPIKEPNFFALEGTELNFQGKDYSHIKRRTINTWDAYQKLFDDVKNEKAIGEASWSSLYCPQACARIKKYCPQTKLMTIIRNPIDRAFAHYLYMVQYEREPVSNFTSAINRENDRINSNWWFDWHYIQIGFYYNQLKRYFETFDRDKIKVYLHKDLLENRDITIKNAFDFLEIDSSFVPNLSQKHNKTGIPKNKFLDQILRSYRKRIWLKDLVKSSFINALYGNLKTVAVSIERVNSFKPCLSLEVRQQLIEIYKDDILKLQDLIQRDLSGWLKE